MHWVHKMEHIPVKDNSGLVRDSRTNAIISRDTNALALQKKKKMIIRRTEQELSNLKLENEKLNTKVDILEKKIDKILEKLG